MKLRFSLVWALLFSLAISAIGQQADKPDEQKPPKKDDSVRISVTLVQVDVTVTDDKGRPVTDLKPEDFEVYEDGRLQKITNFSQIATQPRQGQVAQETVIPPEKNQPPIPAPPARLRPGQVRRTVALVVDDLSLSLESTPQVKTALKKFVDEQMQPGDLVAIIRTGAGMGALQQFTNDKRLLYAAIERVRWSPSRGTIYTFAPVTATPGAGSIAYAGAGLHGGAPKGLDSDGEPIPSPIDTYSPLRSPTGGDLRRGGYTRSDDIAIQLREEIFAVGTLGALGFVVRGLKELPGRKSVILFSDALRIYNREQSVTRIQLALRNLTDQANRASVVVYTIDARGLQTLTMTAADDLGGAFEPNHPHPNRTSSIESLTNINSGLETRRRDFLEAQEGLSYLANETGGLFLRNNNDLNLGIRRALKDQESYYLIGYIPNETTFKSKSGTRSYHD
ncbi:MAG TPA: VWA domain-containing protein, partial [Blastocatellia bacterium]